MDNLSTNVRVSLPSILPLTKKKAINQAYVVCAPEISLSKVAANVLSWCLFSETLELLSTYTSTRVKYRCQKLTTNCTYASVWSSNLIVWKSLVSVTSF
jgi:hypothetical protein